MMNEFPRIAGRLRELGYRPVTAEDYNVFAPYYDAMNEAWSSALSFACIVAWSDAITIQKWTAIRCLLERRASPQMDGLYLPARRFREVYGEC